MYKWKPYMMEYNGDLGESPNTERSVFDFEDLSIVVSVNIINTRRVKPYFKVKKYDENHNLIGLCRISFYSPKYITGYDENMELTKDEIHTIMSELIELRWDIDNWQWLIFKFNDIMDACYNIKPVMPWLPIPNYNKLVKMEERDNGGQSFY